MSEWIKSTTRWAIYFRDGLACLYCGVTLTELIEPGAEGENFLTLDHVKSRHRGGLNGLDNLMACCYACNHDKGRSTTTDYCRNYSLSRSAVIGRTHRRRKKNAQMGVYRGMARMALGKIPGFPVAEIVQDHDQLVRMQWGGSMEKDIWEHLQEMKSQEDLFCSGCGSPKDKIPF